MKRSWIIGLAFAPVVMAADVPGSADLEALPRFPQARISEFIQLDDVERLYPLGALRRIGGQLRMDGEVRARGDLTAITYALPPNHEGLEAFTRSRAALAARDGELLYWCEGRECGASNLWANAIFDQSRLYGPENRQGYLLARLTGEREMLIALYAITRGNGRAYLHVERLQPAQALGEILPSAATLLRQLKDADVLELPRLTAQPDPDWLRLLQRALQQDSTLRVSLSGQVAPVWYEALLEQGVRPWRLEVDDGQAPGLQLHRLR